MPRNERCWKYFDKPTVVLRFLGGWANYAGNIVSENIEGKYARQIEEAMFNLDVDHNRKIKEDKTIPDGQKKNDYDFRHVKPVSTTFPGDVQYTTLTP